VRVWIITVGEPLPGFSGTARPWRSGYLAGLMADRGHEVTWWTSTVDHFARSHFVDGSREVLVRDRLRLQFLHGRLYRKNVSIARLMNHREVAAEFRRLAPQRPRPDIILCSFPTIELSAAATRFGQHSGIPVVLDVRDLWPDEILARSPRPARFFVRALLVPLFREARSALRAASGIIAISESYLQWGLSMAGRQRRLTDRVLPLGYTGPDTVSHSNPEIAARYRALGIDPAKRIFWFSGSFVGSIDLGTVIKAARNLADEQHIQFVLTGAGEQASEWKQEARGLPNVIFTGWAGSDELSWLARMAWAGLAAYRRHASQSFPNKLFEYMRMGLPVLLALEGEARTLVESESIGAAYEPGDYRDLARLIRSVAGDVQWRERCAANALALFERRYSTNIVYTEFAEFIESMALPVKPAA
jgi:glycosyltransferase involved in cell wall biosynthesis